jgi:hypothetical protein
VASRLSAGRDTPLEWPFPGEDLLSSKRTTAPAGAKVLTGEFRQPHRLLLVRQALLLVTVLLGHLALMASPLHAYPSHEEGWFVTHADQPAAAQHCSECSSHRAAPRDADHVGHCAVEALSPRGTQTLRVALGCTSVWPTLSAAESPVSGPAAGTPPPLKAAPTRAFLQVYRN